MCKAMSPSPCPDPIRYGTGTSLIELLCALTAAAVLVFALLEAVHAATEAWNRQTDCLGMEREARTALRLLLDDWQSLAWPPLVESGQPAWPYFLLETPDNPSASSRLAFLRTDPARRTRTTEAGGDLCLILYTVVFTADAGATSSATRQISPKLVRRMFDATETYQRLRAHRLEGRPLLTEADWAALRQLPDRLEPLAHDVVRFRVEFPSSTTPDTPVSPHSTHLDLTLRVTHRSIARLLRGEADWRGEGAGARGLNHDTPGTPNDDREVRTYTLRLPTR